MAPSQLGRAVAVGSGRAVWVCGLAIMRCTSATAVRRTLVAWASGEFGATPPPAGALQAAAATINAMTTTPKTPSGARLMRDIVAAGARPRMRTDETTHLS